MGWDSEQAERGFDGYDDRESNYRSGGRRRGRASYWTPPLKPVPKTCRNCGVGNLRWCLVRVQKPEAGRPAVDGYRLHEVVGTTLIPHFCDPVRRALEISSTEQFNRDRDYRAHCERVGKPL